MFQSRMFPGEKRFRLGSPCTAAMEGWRVVFFFFLLRVCVGYVCLCEEKGLG